MKKFTIILSTICLVVLNTSMAQFTDNLKFGVKGGYLEGTLATQDEWQKISTGFEVGIFGQYDIMDILGVSFEPAFAKKTIGDFDPALIYSSELYGGVPNPKLNYDYKDQKLHLNIVQFPILAQLNLDMGSGIRLFAGPSFDYIAKVSHYTLRDQTGINEDFDFELESTATVTERFQYWNYTAVVGIGMDMEVDPIDLRIDLKYQHGFTDLNVVENKPELYTRYLSVSIGIGLNRLFF